MTVLCSLDHMTEARGDEQLLAIEFVTFGPERSFPNSTHKKREKKEVGAFIGASTSEPHRYVVVVVVVVVFNFNQIMETLQAEASLQGIQVNHKLLPK